MGPPDKSLVQSNNEKQVEPEPGVLGLGVVLASPPGVPAWNSNQKFIAGRVGKHRGCLAAAGTQYVRCAQWHGPSRDREQNGKLIGAARWRWPVWRRTASMPEQGRMPISRAAKSVRRAACGH